MSYVYVKSEARLFTVGFFDPTNGDWHAESDFETRAEAARRVHYLNGGDGQLWREPTPEPAPTSPSLLDRNTA